VIVYILRRVWQAVPVLLLASMLIFSVVHLLPSDPALVLAGPDANEATLAAVRAKFGLDKPLWTQYLLWLGNVLRGDFGVSFVSQMPVSRLIAQAFPATLELALVTLAVMVVTALPLGVLAALRSGRAFDRIVTGAAAFFTGVPNFWLALLLILAFSVSFNLFPPSGRVPLLQDPGIAWRFLVLPVLALAPRLAAVLLLFVRTSTLSVLNEDFVRTARAKGLPETLIASKHVLRNAMLPILTVLSVQFAQLLAGAVVIETIFAWPGMGRLLVNAVGNLDYPVVQAVLLLLVLLFVLINILTDILYGLADPRIRLGS